MAIQRYAVDGINGSAGNSGVASFEGDFSNAVVDIYDALDKANTAHVADSIYTILIEVSGGTNGVTYTPTHNLVFTSSGVGYTASTGLAPQGSDVGDYGIVGSTVAGHSGQVTIDVSTMTTFAPYGTSCIASNRKGTLFSRLRIIGAASSKSQDPILLSGANFSAVRDCYIDQGAHGIMVKNTEDLEITGNHIVGGTGANASCIKIQQSSSPQATRAIVANNYVWKGGSSAGTAGHFGIQLYGAWNCAVYNNTIVDTVTDAIGLIETSKFNEVYNNITVNSTANGNSGTVGHSIGVDGTSTDNLIDYNSYGNDLYYLGGTFTASGGWVGGQQYTSLTSWRTATSQDANSIAALPDFRGGTSPTSLSGIKLNVGSSQIQAGTPVTWSEPTWTTFEMGKDVFGVDYLSPPNMGAVALSAGGSNLTEDEQAYLDAWLAGTKLSGRDFGTLRLTAGGLLTGNYINWNHEIDNTEYRGVWEAYTKPAGRDFGTKRINTDGLISGNYIHTDYPED